MLGPQRQNHLRELIARRGIADLDSLALELSVSASTVRRDVEALVEAGLVQRIHGGVVWRGDRESQPRPYAFGQRLGVQIEVKKRIARRARELVRPGETVLIDGGTTTFYLAEELYSLPLQLVTNSLPIAELLINNENIELILTGGLMYPRYGVLLGPMAERMISEIHTNRMFFSVAGIHEGALYNQNLLLVQAEQRMMDQAQQIVLLADSSKFGHQALVQLCQLKRVHTVVSDEALPAEHQQQVRAAGCELILA
jgi:DeoR/GlpR family transcriptional regulator of sugar metabolism